MVGIAPLGSIHVREASASVRGTELRATIEVQAAPEDIWPFVTDVAALSRRSPQVIRSVVVPAPTRKGSWMFNLNRSADGWRIWPTSARVVRYEPFSEFAFRMNENFTVWSYRLEPVRPGVTRIVHRRETPHGISAPVRLLTAVVMGGAEAFTSEVLEGMAMSLEALKAEVEASVAS